jgi:hypothetical protein
MDNNISYDICGQSATPDDEVRTRLDGKWLHYDCTAGHRFHRIIAGSPVRFAECDRERAGRRGADGRRESVP